MTLKSVEKAIVANTKKEDCTRYSGGSGVGRTIDGAGMTRIVQVAKKDTKNGAAPIKKLVDAQESLYDQAFCNANGIRLKGGAKQVAVDFLRSQPASTRPQGN